ncbi:MAG: PKD domain-containing protein [Bacteroidales bacterium]|nr:PKD domain-containing protein [Bacteroidales bacterium]
MSLRYTSKFIAFLTGIALLQTVAFAQPATQDINKSHDPMIVAPGYIAPVLESPMATVITAADYDNFKLGVDFAECSIANNPKYPNQFYAVWNSTASAGGNGYYTNDGYTWTTANPSWTGMWGDVVVSYDSSGNLAYQNMYGASTIQGVKVAMSANNGQNWSSPVTAMAGVDKNWIASDQTAGPYSNYIYGTMTASSGGNVSKSSNLGSTWSTTTNLTTQSLPGMAVCVGPEGNTQGGAVYVVTNSGSSFSSTFTFYKSIDGGQTFSLKSTQQFSNTVGSQVNGRNSVQNMRTRPYPFIAADNSIGPHRGRLYLVYASNNPSGNGNKPDIFCRYSDNGGTNWSSAVVVNDDANSVNNNNWFPAVWCEKNTGRLYVSWMDTRDCPTSDSCLIYASYSNDGVTFMPNQKISTQKMKINCTSCGGGGTPMYLGDYNGIAANKTTAMLSWTDFRENNFGSYVAYFPDFGMRAEPAIDTLSPYAVINVKVPSVKLFSDTVVVSATISGAPGIFSITYPLGNKLWTFPGEIPVRINAVGAVPAGDYTITLTATGSNGTPIHKRTATVRAIAPVCNFIANTTSPGVGQTVTFTDQSSPVPSNWSWSFSPNTVTYVGGTTANSMNPQVQFNAAGLYSASLTVSNATGNSSFSRPNYINAIETNKTLTLTVFLEGLFNGSTMNRAQNASGNQFPGSTADQITVELHQSVSPYALVAGPYTLNLSTTGVASTLVPAAFNSSYYIVVKHRNSIETWSSLPVSFSPSTISYNFSNSAAQAFGNNLKLSSGKYLVFSGDINQDGLVDSGDMIPLDNDATAFSSGYIVSDLNGDGISDSGDMILLDNNGTAFVSRMIP